MIVVMRDPLPDPVPVEAPPSLWTPRDTLRGMITGVIAKAHTLELDGELPAADCARIRHALQDALRQVREARFRGRS